MTGLKNITKRKLDKDIQIQQHDYKIITVKTSKHFDDYDTYD